MQIEKRESINLMKIFNYIHFSGSKDIIEFDMKKKSVWREM
jgi:hypothetical protein